MKKEISVRVSSPWAGAFSDFLSGGLNNALSTVTSLINCDRIQAGPIYGRMTVDGGTVTARDAYGNWCEDALMLAIPLESPILHEEKTATTKITAFTTSTLVWYDCHALITPSSQRNIIIQQVQGRDFSRKELVSNGDTVFEAHGRIVCHTADEYPATEVKKFIQVMNYKGPVTVNSEITDKFNVSKLIITRYSIAPLKGMKNVQEYSFTAVALKPDSEVAVTEDIIKVNDNAMFIEDEIETAWVNFLTGRAEGYSTEKTVMRVAERILAGELIIDNG